MSENGLPASSGFSPLLDHDRQAFAESYQRVEKTLTPVFYGQSARLWASSIPLIRERSGLEGINATQYEDRLMTTINILSDLESSLTRYTSDTADHSIKVWFHRDVPHVAGIAKVSEEEIKRDLLLETAAKYLAHPWAQHPELDWILLDSLIFAEVTAYRQAVMDGSLVGKLNWAYLLSGGDLKRMVVWNLVVASLGVIFRIALPVFLIWQLVRADRGGAAVSIAFAWIAYLIVHAVSSFKRRRRLRAALSLLERMGQAYSYASPPVVNPTM